MRKSRRVIQDGAHDMELADVNEQELAKAVVEGKTVRDGEKAADVKANEEKQGNIEDLGEKSSADTDAQFVVVEQSCGEIVARGENSGKIISTTLESSRSDSESVEGDSEPPKMGSDADESGGEEREDKNRLGRVYAAVIVACMLVALLILGLSVTYGTVNGGEIETEHTEESSKDTEKNSLPSNGASIDKQIAASLLQSAVSVVAEKEGGGLSYASGTAVIEGGYVATVYSAVKGASSIKIVLDDGNAYPADVVAYNEFVGLALLSTDAKHLRAVTVGEADFCVGEMVYAIGNADGGELDSSLFAGMVSYTSRGYEFGTEGDVKIANTVQISGFDNESMLGCPIFNQKGDVIAIAFAALAGKNTCFALPIDGVLNLLNTMKNGDEPSKEAIGSLAYSPATMSIWGKQSCIDGIWGVEVMDFEDRDGDAAVKLRRGDLIYRINETFVAGTDALAVELSALRSGDEAQIYVLRGGQRLSFDVILG